MSFLRKVLVVVALALLPAALFSFVLLFSFYQIFGNSSHIKKALADSGIYEAAIAQLVQEREGEATGTTTEPEVPAGQRVMQEAIREAIPPSFLEEQTGYMLDSVYAWLQGKESSLQFEINLEPVKEKMVTSITEQARVRAQTLPTCVAPTSPDYNVFDAECVPSGISPETIAEQAKQQVLASELFKDSTLTADDLKGNDGRTLENRLQIGATVYQAIKAGLIVSGLGLLVLILAIIALSTPRRTALRRIGIVFLSVGSVITVLTILGNLLMRGIATGLAESSAESIQAKAAAFARILADDLQPVLLGSGILLIAGGVGILIALHVIKPSPVSIKQRPTARATAPVATQTATSKPSKKSRI